MDNSRTLPEITVNSTPIEPVAAVETTEPPQWLEPGSQGSPEEESSGRGILTKAYVENHREESFLPFPKLRRVLTRDVVGSQLAEVHAEEHLDHICPPNEPNGSKVYFKIFALLLMLERTEEIGKFVEEEVCDQDLPLEYHRGSRAICRREAPRRILSCFSGFTSQHVELFANNQWELLSPFFKLSKEKEVEHYHLGNKTVLPWLPMPKGERSPARRGASGSVTYIKIDPDSHDFHGIVGKITLDGDCGFALKELHDTDDNSEETFQKEVTNLKRFNGADNDHLVTLLATFTYGGKNHLLFPRANCDLEDYWKAPGTRLSPASTEEIQWLAKQLSGLMGAMKYIHEPPGSGLTPGEQQYGRHGDIKPDNILCFKTRRESRVTLVFSDYGLSALHRDTSRSNIPNRQIPPTPGYRPPECDQVGGTVSRAYDIWTLGCLYLELVTWVIGGHSLLKAFDERRNTPSSTGGVNNILFECVEPYDGTAKSQRVKSQVRECIEELRVHQHCTQFTLDVLKIVVDDMLVINSEGRKPSTTLIQLFDKIYKRCKEDSYCQPSNVGP